MPNQLKKIINKYLHKYLELIKPIPSIKASLEERFITTTELVPHDFFKDADSRKCNGDLIFKTFGNPYIIFNDLKGSTKILKECESLGKECIYIGYINYTSRILADVLNLIGGKIVEITGDGNYSIVEESTFKRFRFKTLYDELDDLFTDFNIRRYFKNYQSLFAKEELDGLNDDKKNYEKLRQLVFCVFSVFNIQVNKKLKLNQYNFEFAMRVGCKQGDCKITRFSIGNDLDKSRIEVVRDALKDVIDTIRAQDRKASYMIAIVFFLITTFTMVTIKVNNLDEIKYLDHLVLGFPILFFFISVGFLFYSYNPESNPTEVHFRK